MINAEQTGETNNSCPQSCTNKDFEQGKTKKRNANGGVQTVDDLLKDIDKLTKSLKVPNAKKKIPKKEIFRISSYGYKSGKSAKRQNVKKKKINHGVTKDLCNLSENVTAWPESGSHDDLDARDPETEVAAQVAPNTNIEIDAILESCDLLISELEGSSKENRSQRQTWFERNDAALTKWENVRQELVESLIHSQYIEKGAVCHYCNEREASIICKQCKGRKHLCFVCDDVIHSAAPLHDRLFYTEKRLKKLTPCQGINSAGDIINVVRHPIMNWPSECPCCKCKTSWERYSSQQPCIVVNHQGRFDLFKFLLRCNNCNFEVDIFSDVPYIIASRYWPGTVDTATFLFDEDMFISWDSFRLRMPGSSEYGFLNSLSDISKDNNRISRIQKDAFSKAFKEFKYLQYELCRIKEFDSFQCPPCHISQHAAIFDGNMKTYRYKSGGRKMRESYYKDKFFCKNEDVSSVIDSIYQNPRSSKNKVRSKSTKFQIEKERMLASTNFVLTKESLSAWKKSATEHAQASQNLPAAINLSRCQEFLLIAMKLKSTKRIPVNIGCSVNIQDIVPFSLERIKLRALAKPIEGLITRYSELNTQLSEDTIVSPESELDALKSMLLTVQQRRIEALFYSNLHISANLGRLSDNCKKRRQLRLKVASQKEELKQVIKQYNDNVTIAMLQKSFPMCKLEDLSRGEFPWSKSIDNDDSESVTQEFKQALLLRCLTLERLAEEETLLKLEMRNYLVYYVDVIVPLLKKKISSCEESMNLCSCQESSTDELTLRRPLCRTCRQSLGLRSLAFQGLDNCAKQIEYGRKEFRKYLMDDTSFTNDELRMEVDSNEKVESDSESDSSSIESCHNSDDEEESENSFEAF
ncbi:uncharacterized protein LOC135683533 isoform X3 [Rhopilema esculentum]|uniref:uncharacterized protein LOC135683533 isoform X3 n=1 Tax=Rhopilema esculentum TaxID=499914 RepID=UPI0031D6F348